VIEHATLGQPTEAIDLAAILVPGEAYGIWRETIEAAPDKMFDRVRERFRAGGDVSAPDFVAAQRGSRRCGAIGWRRRRPMTR
jgi:aspartyl-tRNA(Asn)/glutamyl-tRNA(Gln) amidotransferase subunit A